MSDPTAVRSFSNMKIATISQLAKWLSCSIPTVRRRLKEWGAYTSYNHNGRYYTLPRTPDFDEHGLWRYQGVFFQSTAISNRRLFISFRAQIAVLVVRNWGSYWDYSHDPFFPIFVLTPICIGKKYRVNGSGLPLIPRSVSSKNKLG